MPRDSCIWWFSLSMNVDVKWEPDPRKMRQIKRKHFDMLTEILRRQAYKDNPH